MTPILNDLTEVIDHFSESADSAFAVRDDLGTLFLLSIGDEGVFYVGVPFEADEGGITIDHHTALLENQKNISSPKYPLVVLGEGHA